MFLNVETDIALNRRITVTCIKEDRLNDIIDYANSRPSQEQLNEYVNWKKTERAGLARDIECLSDSDAWLFAFTLYVETIEFADSREIIRLLDRETLSIESLHFSEMTSIVKNAEKDIPELCIAKLICDAHDEKHRHEYKKYNQDSLIYIVCESRLPILNDIKSLLAQKTVKERILSEIPR